MTEPNTKTETAGGFDSTTKGVVLFNVRQVTSMQDIQKVLLRYFAGRENGRAQYVNGECITPTMEQAVEALHLLGDILGHPLTWSLDSKPRNGPELAQSYGDARI